MGVKVEKCEDSIRRLFVNVCINVNVVSILQSFDKIIVLMGKMLVDENAKI